MEPNLKLTSCQYKQHLHTNPLVEIKYYFESYNELSEPIATNPISGKKINLAKLLNPMCKPLIMASGTVFLLTSLVISFYILNSGSGSIFLSILTWGSALAGAAMLLPALVFHFIHQIKHARAKDHGRFVAQGVKKTYRPDLTKVTDELLMALFADDSPLTVEVFMLLQNLEKNILSEEIIGVLNYIFNDESSELLHLTIKEAAFAQSKINFVKILDEGLGISDNGSFIEDPKIIQLITYSIVIKLLTNPHASGNLTANFPKLDNTKLIHDYETFCEEFLNYCKKEYELEAYVDEVEGRIMSCVVDLI